MVFRLGAVLGLGYGVLGLVWFGVLDFWFWVGYEAAWGGEFVELVLELLVVWFFCGLMQYRFLGWAVGFAGLVFVAVSLSFV